MRRVSFVAMIALTVTGCATIRAASTRSTEQMLAAAGFHMELAETPERAPVALGTVGPLGAVVREAGRQSQWASV